MAAIQCLKGECAMPHLRITLIFMVLAASLPGCSGGNEVESKREVEKLALTIPKKYRVSDNSSFLSPGVSGLDEEGELLFKLPISELDLHNLGLRADEHSAEVILLLVSAADSKQDIVTDAQHAWLGTGLYQERIIEYDSKVGMIRIYPKSGHPMIWNYFLSSPESDSKGTLEDQWIANCRLQPGSTDLTVTRAQCVSRFYWRNFEIEAGFSGALVQHYQEIRRSVTERFDSWARSNMEGE